MTAARSVIVMARQPVFGEVKTRLASTLGPACALAVYSLMLKRTLRRVSRGRWCTVVAATPSLTSRSAGSWARGLPVISQSGRDLGERMQSAFDAMPPGPVVMVGTDIPGIRCRHIAEAFRALRCHDAVFGPSLDGGYWLVGLSPALRCLGIFTSVRWSTHHALADTLNGVPDTFSHAMLETLHDIDTADDVERWLKGNPPLSTGVKIV